MHFNLRFGLRRIITAIAILFIATYPIRTWANPSFAFYYGTDIPWEALGAFDVAVVEPGNVGVAGWQHRLNPGTTVAAYIAVGEVHPTRPYFSLMRPEWRLGDNPAWGSIVVDQAAPGWRAFYLAQVVKPLWDRGFRAFFLDTLDSFYLVAKTPEAQQKQIAGMAALVRDIKRAYPDAKLIFNRGFEILPQVHTLAHAVAAESLFQGWDAGRKQYVSVPQADRDWILAQLRKCQTEYKLPVIAIDYVPPKNRALARETARKIKALGIIPWVTNPALDMMGVGQVEVLPRQVLAIHDEPGHLADVSLHEVHRIGAMPLNYLGLDVRYVYYGSPEFEALSRQTLIGRYAGVLTWFNRGSFPETPTLLTLMQAARDEGVPLVIVDDLPGAATLAGLGVEVGQGVRQTKPLTLEKLSPHVGFEIEPAPLADNFEPSRLVPGQGDVWLRVRSESSGTADVVAITSWGGFALDRHLKVNLPADQGARWVVNPIEFFRAAFRLDSHVPVPDVTTETGRRLLLIHVDGDGFPSRAELPGTPLASEVMLKEFLQRYRWPSTVSIIEGEVAPRGLFAELSPLMEKTAREIFALPHVEMASHTFSHPFYWADAELGLQVPGRVVGLKIPGYSYDVAREIAGAADYIDRLAPAPTFAPTLASAGGPNPSITPAKKTRVLLWSGNTEPLATPVRVAYETGLLNMNGGVTTITKAEPTLTLVAPLGMMKGDYFQVYAPMQNENLYTNSWTGPFYGYERVLETFQMTDQPLRLKPVNIYYHTFIASKRAGIASLHKVYDWAADQLKLQRLHPVFASEYIERVLDWRRATVARTDTGLELRGGQHLRQWRVAANAPWPALDDASGIAGVATADSASYLNTTKSIANYSIRTSANAIFYLESANAKLISWRTVGNLQQMQFEGHLPLHARFHAPRCELQPATGQRGTRRGDMFEVEGSVVGKNTVILRCAE